MLDAAKNSARRDAKNSARRDAKNSARRDAKLQFSCENGSCLNRHADLSSFAVTMSVERGFWGWVWGILGGKGWKAVASYTFTANVWCEQSPDTSTPPGSSD